MPPAPFALLVSEEIAIVDNLSGKLYLIVYADTTQPESYSKARQRLKDLRVMLRRGIDAPVTSASVRTEAVREFAKEDYLKAVARAHEYVMAGDLMQVQIGQRIRKPYVDNPLTLYRSLRSLNPSPYMYFYNFGDFHVVGASPEILVRQEVVEHEGKRSTLVGTMHAEVDVEVQRVAIDNPPHDRGVLIHRGQSTLENRPYWRVAGVNARTPEATTTATTPWSKPWTRVSPQATPVTPCAAQTAWPTTDAAVPPTEPMLIERRRDRSA